MRNSEQILFLGFFFPVFFFFCSCAQREKLDNILECRGNWGSQKMSARTGHYHGPSEEIEDCVLRVANFWNSLRGLIMVSGN